MEDNSSSSSDDEIKDSTTSPKSGGKKLKLNDGSSQDSVKEKELSSNKKDENVDSGISADKSESTSSDDRAAGASEGPSNEVINAAPSGSNVRAILLNLRRPKCNRFYRKRKTPDRDSDSSRDSDDISVEETADGTNENSVENQWMPPFPTSRSNENSSSENENEDLRRFANFAHFLRPNLDYGASDSSSSSNDSTSSLAESNDTYESDDVINIASIDTDSDYDVSAMTPPENGSENDENTGKPPSVLLKTRPKHSYLMLREIINREMGLTFPCGKAVKEDVMFEQRFYGSLHAVYRMKKLHSLNKHKGCVNSINFHPEGHLLASGSDDTNVIVWDWARNSVIQTIKTGHRSNVFQSKFLHLNAKSQLNIVTCARDGQVRLLQCHPAGGVPVSRRKLVTHSLAAHKLHVCASEPHLVVSAGEDGLVAQSDVRTEHVNRLFHVREKGQTIPLYSVCGNPVDGRELLVAGRDRFVRVYDHRKSNKPIAMYCPAFFNDPTTNKSKKKINMHLTCAVYNHNGTEILGSYNDEDIYLFDAKNDVYDKDNTDELKEGFTHRYSGHRNSATFKGVAFFGPRSEYIVSGSDCSHIYIWEKKTEAIVQWLKGDVKGVVNCIETHPRCPVLATSGLDKDVKIWLPRSQSDPTYDGLEKVVKNNNISQLRSPLFNDFLPTLYNVWRGGNRFFSDDDESVPLSYGGNIEIDGNNCTTC